MKSRDNFGILKTTSFQDRFKTMDKIVYRQLKGASDREASKVCDFFVFLLFEKGSGIHSIDFVEHQVREGQIHVIFPGQVHRWNLGEDTVGQKLIIDRMFFEALSCVTYFSFVRDSLYSVINLDAKVFRKISAEFREIQEELSSSTVSWQIINYRSRLITLMIGMQAEKKYKQMIQRHVDPVLCEFLSLVDENFSKERSVFFYAEKLHLVPNYLNILCKKQFGKPASHFIKQRVVLEAKRLMYCSGIRINEIAFELGFEELSYFSRYFKSNTGFSPKKYRLKVNGIHT